MSKQFVPTQAIQDAAAAAASFGAAAGAVDASAARLFGVNRTDLRIIGILERDGPLPAGSLAVACGLSPAATSTAIQRLVAAGHVTRRTDDGDRRRALVAVTESAAALLSRIYGPVGMAGIELLAKYDDSQLATIAEFLRAGTELQLSVSTRIDEFAV